MNREAGLSANIKKGVEYGFLTGLGSLALYELSRRSMFLALGLPITILSGATWFYMRSRTPRV
jgi:hypothetical protein